MDTLANNISAVMLDNFEELNSKILLSFNNHLKNDAFRKTHLFNGRYENLYINREEMEEIEPILQKALSIAEKQFSLAKDKLKIGFWFNRMAPGEETTWHRHDDDDEILSGVYYITVAENSGNLLIEDGDIKRSIPPVSGRMVCFPPDKPHSVETNNSDIVRLSLAFNIGHDNEDW